MLKKVEAAPRYAPVSPAKVVREGSTLLSGPRLLAPMLGSKLLFPGYFDRRVEAALSTRTGGFVAPHFAFRYFGPALRLWVDPGVLQWRLSDYVESAGTQRWVGDSFIDAGDWSAALALVARSPVHREIVQLVEADLDFRSTRAYRRHSLRLAQNRPQARNGVLLSSPEKIEAYFRYCVDLAQSIQRTGVVPRDDLSLWTQAKLRRAGARPASLDWVEDDIGVAIDAEGRLIRHLGGKHRTAFAQAFRLERIPVKVRLIHVDWIGRIMQETGLSAQAAVTAGLETYR